MLYQIGEKVVYYPSKDHADDNLHFVAEVVGLTARRIRIQYDAIDGRHVRSVAAKRLARQSELPM